MYPAVREAFEVEVPLHKVMCYVDWTCR
jgi:hypothetical protein